jgi:release factor glutamine methyltransferase
LIEGSWYAPLAGSRFDIIVSNPPYVAAGDDALALLAHEPQLALVAGAEGLDALTAVVAGAPAHLAPGGWLLVEHGANQGDAVRGLLRSAGLARIATRADLAGLPRVTEGEMAR